jgi:hypothetical protein
VAIRFALGIRRGKREGGGPEAVFLKDRGSA